MVPQQLPIIYYSTDGLTTCGPVSEEALRQLYTEGTLSDGALVSKPDNMRNYERWFPFAKMIKSASELGSDATAPQSIPALLYAFSGYFIGLNLSAPTTLEVVRLKNVASDFFTVEP